MLRTCLRKMIPLFAVAVLILKTAPAAADINIWFSGSIEQTDISGRQGSVVEPLTGPDDSEFALTGISSKERSDEPCWVSMVAKSILNGGLATRSADKCGSKGPKPKSQLTTNVALTTSQTYLSGVQVCMNRAETKIKGWKIYTTAFSFGDNKITVLESLELMGGPRRNCRHWKSVEKCPVGLVAVAAELHFLDSGKRHSWSGIRLKCRDLRRITKFTLGPGEPEDNKRGLSEPVSMSHTHPDGVSETRQFLYSTPTDFLYSANRKVNLWLVLHGQGQQPDEIHEFFDKIPLSAPTVLVYPASLITDNYNVTHATVDTEQRIDQKWRQPRLPVQARDPNAFRDVVFIEHLLQKLLRRNPQLDPGRVYVTGFSSGAGMSWTMLCYRSELFRGFAMYSGALKAGRERGGCGDGQISSFADRRTGYEILTGRVPDRYGRQSLSDGSNVSSAFPTKAVFYTHGTEDGLEYTGVSGCYDRQECRPQDDPQYSMDPDGDVHRDDKSTFKWLLRRHGLAMPKGKVVPDEQPDSGQDQVRTIRFLAQGTPTDNDAGAPVLWYRVDGGGHFMSAVDRGGGDMASKDYDVSLHTQRFFHNHAGMRK